MTVEYVVLGVILVVMGAVQIWLRYGPWAKEQQAAESAVARRQAERRSTAQSGPAEGAQRAAENNRQSDPGVRERGNKVWTTWTAILGPLAIIFGLVLVILGALGL